MKGPQLIISLILFMAAFLYLGMSIEQYHRTTVHIEASLDTLEQSYNATCRGDTSSVCEDVKRVLRENGR